MLDIRMLALNGEQIAVLDDQALASIAGGDGVRDWLVKKVGELLFDCLTGALDTIISAAEEGYEDAR
jgi:hypothetical protein